MSRGDPLVALFYGNVSQTEAVETPAIPLWPYLVFLAYFFGSFAK
jgi:hypothetical protein